VYVRPQSKDNGCDEDFVSSKQIALYEEKIIKNLKETVIDKILCETEFKKNTGWNCENCGYAFLCDKSDEVQ
jgi:hypothetical protein